MSFVFNNNFMNILFGILEKLIVLMPSFGATGILRILSDLLIIVLCVIILRLRVAKMIKIIFGIVGSLFLVRLLWLLLMVISFQSWK